VCRSHLEWWGRHNTLALVMAGARISNIGRPSLETVAFMDGTVVDDFCETMLDVRGRRGCDTIMRVYMRPDDLLVIADWLEIRGEDATAIRHRLTSLVMARQVEFWPARP
jgi:hypothetical protein